MITAFLMAMALNSRAEQTKTNEPAHTAESSLDERIKSLENSKDCIHDAKTKAEIDQCRKRLVIKVKGQ